MTPFEIIDYLDRLEDLTRAADRLLLEGNRSDEEYREASDLACMSLLRETGATIAELKARLKGD